MNPPGDADLRLRTRRTLLDALAALEDQIDALIVIGAQAVYLHTREIEISAGSTRLALEYSAKLFAAGPEAIGSAMAGEAERTVGDPSVASASVAALAGDLLSAVEARR